MTQARNWLKARAPGFNNLSKKEQDAITDFSLLWGFFESRILDTNGSARAICDAIETWHATGILDPGLFDAELAYFKQRYCPNGGFSDHFERLRLQRPDKAPMVRDVLDGTETAPRETVAAVLTIIYRYRNNLFHGVKWGYELADQLHNFTHANNALMKALDRYGELG